jgi:pimeloyl-ACP methyl ester carboxylesterase
MNVVLLPGLDGTGDLFAGLVRTAPAEIEVSTVHYPDHRVLDYDGHLEIARRHLPAAGPFLLVAESFSGPIGIRLAAAAPTGLVGLVLCNTFARRPSWRGFRYLPWELFFRRPVPRFTVRRRLVGRWTSPEWVRIVREATADVDPAVLAARMRSVLSVDASEELRRVAVPLLYLRGTRDGLVPRRSLEHVRAVKPSVEVVELDAPHMLLEVAPEAAWEAITHFLTTRYHPLGGG